MYEAFYGFREKPFSMLPDPGFLYLSKKHQAALTLLEYGLLNHVGFCVISGEAGAGKTTILRALLERVDANVTVGLITNTHQSFGGLLDWVLSAFDLHQPDLSHVEMHQIFMDYLIDEYANNRTVLLIVDEAQNMKPDALEELRMLSNVNSDKDQLMQVVLAGQPALKETLRKPELMQFAQRIAVDYHLDALNLKETCGYIQHRLKKAGATRDVFTPAACARIYNYSGGTPRLINLLCETVLVYGFADQEETIGVELIDEMVQERMKDSVVPICNRETENLDKLELGDLEKDFPWIASGEDADTDTPAEDDMVVDAQASATETGDEQALRDKDEWPPLDDSILEKNSALTLKGQDEEGGDGRAVDAVTGNRQDDDPEENAGSINDRGTGRSTTGLAEAAAQAAPVKSSTAAVTMPGVDATSTGKTNALVKYAMIAGLLAFVLVGLAIWLSGDDTTSPEERSSETGTVKTNTVVSPTAESLEKMKKLEQEAAALKRERDAALKKIEEERRAKAEAERLAAEKAAQAKKAAEEKRRIEEAERKRLAAIREKERRAKEAAERAKWEAEQAKREAARLAEEKRLMQQRLEEERRIKAEQEARRLELERLEQQRLEAERARERELARQQQAQKPKKTLPADCAGPTARFKSGCR